MKDVEWLKQERATVTNFFLTFAEDNMAEVYGFLGDMAMEIKEAIDHKQNRNDRLQILEIRLQQCAGTLQTASLALALARDEEANGDKVTEVFSKRRKDNEKAGC